LFDRASSVEIADCLERLYIFDSARDDVIQSVIATLKQDSVALIRAVTQQRADALMFDIAQRLGLTESLELQAGFAEFMGHRHRIGKYFMSVNKRHDYDFITPHCEGTSLSGMQLAAFLCTENTTDGGETILLHVAESSPCWSTLREKAVRGKLTREPLTAGEINRARALHKLRWPTDMLRTHDEILQQYPSEIPGLMLFDVLTPVRSVFSAILKRSVTTYWDSVAIIDFDAVEQFARLLRHYGLLKEPPGGLDSVSMDSDRQYRIMRSGIEMARFFTGKIVHKLAPGELVVLNNTTWAHAANNWSPQSGTRTVAAAFA
jgi:hypothetical protein